MLKRNSHEERDVYVEERAWSKAFEHLAVSVAQLTLDGRLLSANNQMCEAIGQAQRETCWGKASTSFSCPRNHGLSASAAWTGLLPVKFPTTRLT